MSFYSYKNANAGACPGAVAGSPLNGLDQRVCVMVKNVYDSCLQQEQLDNVQVTVSDIVPVLSGNSCASGGAVNRSCSCVCSGCSCNCTCPTCGNGAPTYEEAVENAAASSCIPQPQGNWSFESCRSSSTCGVISNLTIDRLCDRPQFARIRGNVNIPIDVLFVDAACQEWMGRATVTVAKDVLMAIPEESIVPFTLDSMVSAICVKGSYIGNCTFEITICVTIVLKILAEVELLIPTYGFCQIPPCEEYAENVCDEFFSLPLFPQQATCVSPDVETTSVCRNPEAAAISGAASAGSTCTSCASSCTCSRCGTTCAAYSGNCPRCGCAMTRNS